MLDINQETDYMIENGYAEMQDGYFYFVHRSIVMEELLDWGEISSEDYFHSHGGTCDYAMSSVWLNLKCDRETAENIFEIVSAKTIVKNQKLYNGLFGG